jgi:hypothetical protein
LIHRHAPQNYARDCGVNNVVDTAVASLRRADFSANTKEPSNHDPF